MMRYTLSCANPNNHFLQISIEIEINEKKEAILFLPSWRPGRYEIADYAKNLRGLSIQENNKAVPFQKITKNKWLVDTSGCKKLEVNYEYYAFEMTAGTSWVDDEQWYINFINCMLSIEGMDDGPVEVTINVPQSYKLGGALPLKNNVIKASGYQELVDSPFIASSSLKHHSFELKNTTFHLWIQGEVHFDINDFINDITKYTAAQTALFGAFPTTDYHYLFQFLPYKYYHGVEHKNSTVITIGPAAELKDWKLYKELLGVSSHELFHAWNVTRIRPKEMLPYDFSEETFTNSGLITEGLTTYYGDLMLYRGDAFTEEHYLNELNSMLSRHLLNSGRHYSSIIESSHDLWLDGYKLSAPGRKVSIYTKGALIAWILDLKLQQKEKSLDDVMRNLWEAFGDQKKGYTLDDYFAIVQQHLGEETERYFEEYVYGTRPIEEELPELLSKSPYQLEWVDNKDLIARYLGIKLDSNNRIVYIDPQSDAFEKLSLQDEVISIDGIKADEWGSKKECSTIIIDRFSRAITTEVLQGNYLKLPKLLK